MSCHKPEEFLSFHHHLTKMLVFYFLRSLMPNPSFTLRSTDSTQFNKAISFPTPILCQKKICLCLSSLLFKFLLIRNIYMCYQDILDKLASKAQSSLLRKQYYQATSHIFHICSFNILKIRIAQCIKANTYSQILLLFTTQNCLVSLLNFTHQLIELCIMHLQFIISQFTNLQCDSQIKKIPNLQCEPKPPPFYHRGTSLSEAFFSCRPMPKPGPIPNRAPPSFLLTQPS